jgi:geranylgeranyl diphosphate synthase type I
MIRGVLVNLAYNLFSSKKSPHTVPLGAVMELFQSALLIHDDIMDRDQLRRGNDTVFYQYYKWAQKHRLFQPEHTGVSLGICGGDIALFLAFQLLSEIKLPLKMYQRIIKLFAKELSYVGAAQMADVYFGAENAEIAEKDILNLYCYKTGRYTFSLPFMTGAILSDAPEDAVTLLEEIGIDLGIIFQIKDDELGLCGTEETIGKPVGSDIKERKKTLLLHLLYQYISKEEKKIADAIFQKTVLEPEDIQRIRFLADKYSIVQLLNAKVEILSSRIVEKIQSLPNIQSEPLQLLLQLVRYNRGRSA